MKQENKQVTTIQLTIWIKYVLNNVERMNEKDRNECNNDELFVYKE